MTSSSFYLSKSKIRNRLLGYLFSNPNRHYYLSELSRLVRTSPGNIQRELRRFIEDELIKVEKKGNLNFYILNDQHALFPEIRSLVVKTAGVEAALRRLVQSQKEITMALLYGSFARGEERGQSDIDLLIISNQDLRGFYSKLRKLETSLSRDINPTVYTSKEWAKKLKENHTFTSHILQEPHILLKGSLTISQNENSKRTRKSA